MRHTRLSIVLLALWLAGCSFIPKYQRPPMDMPERWRTTTSEATSLANLAWWQLFKDPVLQDLIRIALEENKDLHIAALRIEEARAFYGIRRSDLFPHLEATASGIATKGLDSYGFLAALPSWEIDFFGRLRALTEVARRDVLSREDSRRALYISLIAEVAETYLLLRDLDQRLRLAREALKTRIESQRLTKRRFEVGYVSELDVQETDILVDSAKENIAQLERQIPQTENRLSILLGRNPQAIPRGRPLSAQGFPEKLPAGLPSTLLERRPDILAAEQELLARNANIGAARSAFFPRITLTGLVGGQSTELLNLTSAAALRSQWLVAGQLAQPIFTAGRLTSDLKLAKARQRIAIEFYKQAIQNAFKEVNDALVAHQKLRDQRQAQEGVVAAQRKRFQLVNSRYLIGVTSFFEVLDAQRSLLQDEFNLSEIQRDYLASVVQLYKALGGGWSSPNKGGGQPRSEKFGFQP